MKYTKLMACAGAAGLLAAPVIAEDHDEDEIEFDVAEIFFELNNTDGDLGIHSLIDGEPWKRLKIEDPNERRMLGVGVRGRLRRQGLAEIFFESAEPTFDDLPPAVFFKRFPEGTYEIEGYTLDWRELESETQLTHAMPAPPVATVNGTGMVEVCDEEDDEFIGITSVALPVVIAWQPVTRTHPELGSPLDSDDIAIYNYQLVVETDLEIDGEEFTTVFSAVVPPDVTEITVPDEFLEQSDEFKYEVLAREESWNQTAVESCFLIDE